MAPPRRTNGDLDILPQIRQKLQQPPHRKTTGTITHEQRNMRLFDTKRHGSLALCHASLLDDPINLKCQSRFDQMLFRIGQTEIGEDIVAAFGDPGRRFRFPGGFGLSHISVLPFSVISLSLGQPLPHKIDFLFRSRHAGF